MLRLAILWQKNAHISTVAWKKNKARFLEKIRSTNTFDIFPKFMGHF